MYSSPKYTHTPIYIAAKLSKLCIVCFSIDLFLLLLFFFLPLILLLAFFLAFVLVHLILFKKNFTHTHTFTQSHNIMDPIKLLLSYILNLNGFCSFCSCVCFCVSIIYTRKEGNKHAYFHFRQVYYRIFVDTTAVIYANISLVLSVHFFVCVSYV